MFALPEFRAVLPALNLFVVPKSKVAKEAQENPQNFVKPLVASDVLLLWIGKPGAKTCRWRIMCLMDSINEEHVDRHQKASQQNRLPGSQPNDVCAIILMKLSRSIRTTGKSVAMWVCGFDPRNQ